MVDFIGRSAAEPHVAAMVVVPSHQRMELAQKRSAPEWPPRQPRDALFKRQDQPLDYRDTPVLPHGPKAWPDSTTLTPLLVNCTQPRGSGIFGDDDLAGMVTLQEALRTRLLEAYHNLQPVHELSPERKEPKLAGPAQDRKAE